MWLRGCHVNKLEEIANSFLIFALLDDINAECINNNTNIIVECSAGNL